MEHTYENPPAPHLLSSHFLGQVLGVMELQIYAKALHKKTARTNQNSRQK